MRRVSVIIPVLDGASHIGNAFRFLSEQTYTNFETIFVVDCKTTDDTLNEIEHHMNELNDVRIIMQHDDGLLGEARNIGFRESTGDIIWFLDVDDHPLPDFLTELVTVMEENNADVVMCNHIRSSKLELKNFPPEGNYAVKVMNREEALKARLAERIPVTAWSKIISRDLIERANLRFIHEYSEDVEYTYQVLSNSKTICYHEKPMYIYYQHPDSICNRGSVDDERGLSETETYERLEKYFEDDKKISSFFKRGSSIIRLRSATHMSRKKFVEYAKSQQFEDMMNRNLSDPISVEAMIARVFPSLYYYTVKTYLDFVFYRDGRCYTKYRKTIK